MDDIRKPNGAHVLATDRLDLLKLFVCIAETGRLTAAARSLGLSQPSASRCLKLLETRLDTRLVQRSPRGVVLTPSGRDFLAHAYRVLAEWDAAVEATKTDRHAIEGLIRIVAPIAIGGGLLASIAARFLCDHPAVSLDWEMRDDAVDLAATDYDVWIRAGVIQTDDLVVRAIYRVQRAIVAASRHDAVDHPRDLLAKSAVRLATFVQRAVELKNDVGQGFLLEQSCVFTTNNIHAAHTAVLEGIGYAVLPLWLVQADLNRGVLVQSCRAWRPSDLPLSIAYPPNPRRPARIDAFVARLQAELTRHDGLGLTFLERSGARETVTIASAASRTS